MKRQFTLDYWMDDGWYIGKLREVPNVFSQGETFEELQRNIQDAFALRRRESPTMPAEDPASHANHRISVQVCFWPHTEYSNLPGNP